MKIHVCIKQFTPCVTTFSNTSKLVKILRSTSYFNSLVGVEMWPNMVYFVFDVFHTICAATYTSLHTPWSSMTSVCRWCWSIWCTVLCWFHICWSFSKEYSVDNECYTIHIRNQVNSLERLSTLTRERVSYLFRQFLTASGLQVLTRYLYKLCW